MERAIVIGLLSAVVFTALAQGAVDFWSVALFQVIVVAMIFLWGIKSALDKRVKMTLPPTILPIVALLAFGLIQSAAVSLDEEATRKTVTMLFFLVVASLAAATFLTDEKRLRTVTNFLITYGIVMAMFALVQHFTWNGKFYWFKPNTQGASPFGPFVSHNHFAGYMEMLIPLPVALVLTGAVRFEARLFYSFAALMMTVAAVASLSRGGMISLAAVAAFLAVWAWKMKRARTEGQGRSTGFRARRHRRAGAVSVFKAAAAVVAIFVALVLALAWIGPDQIFDRITGGTVAESRQESFYTSRGWIWKDTLAMIRSHSLLGVGLGAFETAYPISSSSNGQLIVGEAHNDYLQILAEGGIVGAALALWFIYAVFRAVSIGTRSRDRLLAGLALGSGASVFAILVHSLLDFNLQLPSNALLFLLFSTIVSTVSTAVMNGDGSRLDEHMVVRSGPEGPAASRASAAAVSEKP